MFVAALDRWPESSLTTPDGTGTSWTWSPEPMLREAVGLFLGIDGAFDGRLEGADYTAWLNEWEARLWNLRATYRDVVTNTEQPQNRRRSRATAI